MSKRAEAVDVLQRYAFAADLLEEPGTDAKALSSAAWTVRQLEGDIEELHRSGELAKVRGLGKHAHAIVARVIEGLPLEGLEAMEARIPAGLFELRRIKGLGPKKTRTLWKELGITTIGELEYACNENRLITLKGFGAKTQENVKKAITELRERAGLLRLDQGAALGRAFVSILERCGSLRSPRVVGDVRRGKELVDRLDVLAEATGAGAAAEVEAAIAALFRAVAHAISDGAIEPADDTDEGAAPREPGSAETVEVEGLLRVRGFVWGVPVEVALSREPEALGAQLVLLTGSEGHVSALRAIAAERGLALDLHGLRRGPTGETIPARSEADVYRELGVVEPDPEQREAGAPFGVIRAGRARPRLVTRTDLQGALHNHTTASDGIDTLTEMRRAAIRLGLSYLSINDHSPSAFYARGLTADRLVAQEREIDAMNEDAEASKCRLLRGVESDILGDGKLDHPDEILKDLEVVIASVHNRMGHKREEMTRRMVAAAANRWTDVIGHPTGRLLLGRAPSELDMGAFLDACKRSGCAVELNASPHRLDLDERHLAMAKERGVPVSIGADAHATGELASLDLGVTIARRAGLAPEDVLNCRSLEELLEWLRARRQSAST